MDCYHVFALAQTVDKLHLQVSPLNPIRPLLNWFGGCVTTGAAVVLDGAVGQPAQISESASHSTLSSVVMTSPQSSKYRTVK